MDCEIDGVLCVKRPEKVRDNTCKYERWVQSAAPLMADTEVHWIITGRIRKYKKHTEEWLAKHGIRYERLVMWTGEPESRWRMGALAKWKAEQFAASECDVFHEADAGHATIIRQLSGKRVELI
jgi:uncharacterized HAD superfamily protein